MGRFFTFVRLQLHDVLEEVGYSDQADHVINVRTSTTATAAKQDAELDDDVSTFVGTKTCVELL